tara:strand:- start:7656 stop:8237 length:582 start_codon:yes stop_codon:yes gene_type:complete
MSALAVSTIPLTVLMKDIYQQAISDNIEEGYGDSVTAEQADAAISAHLATVNNFNFTTQNQVEAALASAALGRDKDGSDLNITFKIILATVLIKAVFNKLRSKRKSMIVDSAVFGPYNQGLFDSAANADTGINKQWIALKDERVRISHKQLNGDKLPVSSAFFVDGVPIRFPHDPLAPPGLTINCRCVLKFTR